MRKILILDNDNTILSSLRDLLKSKGYFVNITNSVFRIEDLLSKDNYDLFLCEYSSSDTDLILILEKIKEKKLFMRVMTMSSDKSLINRIEALKISNDFIGKPFNLLEIFLKIKNLLNLEKKEFGSFMENNFLLNDHQEIKMKKSFRPKELKILECFFKHKNITISYETISSYVWGYSDKLPLKKTINVYIRRIRSKLFYKDIRIVTIKGIGYRLISKF